MKDDGPSDRAWIPAVGDVVAGRYKVERLLGAGGMGAVVAARHVGLGDEVAVKFLKPKLAPDPTFAERFLREARVTARVKDEHVVRVFDVGTTDTGLPFLAMELLEGEDLASIAARGPMPIALAVDCFLQAAAGLLHAHAAGVVHRDVKPANLWLTHKADGSPLVKVLDFGISKVADPNDKRLTETNTVFGSPTYMSPEQVRSARNVDARTDVWALGIVLYELLTGKLPFDADTTPGVLAAIVADAPPALRAVRPDAPAEIEQAIASMLEKTPEKRASLAEIARLLRPFASPSGNAAADLIERQTSGALVVASQPRISTPTAVGDTLPQLSTSANEPRERSAGYAWAIIAVLVLVLGSVYVGVVRQRPKPSAVTTTTLSPMHVASTSAVAPSPKPATTPPPASSHASAVASVTTSHTHSPVTKLPAVATATAATASESVAPPPPPPPPATTAVPRAATTEL